MSSIGDFNTNMFGAIYGTSNGNNNSSGISLSTYASIKNGSYGKALKAYYNSESGKEELRKSGIKNSQTTMAGKDTTNSLARMQTTSKELSESAAKLLQGGSKSVFATIKEKDSNGNEKDTGKYDTDKIYKSVKGFVDSYNSMIDNVVSTKTTNIATSAAGMINMTSLNSGMLANLGISVGDDYKLELNEEDFKKADMSAAKSMFGSQGSYGYQVSSKASMISYYSQNEISKASNYTGKGNYNLYSILGSSYDSTT